jgi:hypothetical protein
VSVVQLAICAGACATGMIPMCAFCLGIDVSLILFCSLGCSVYAGPIELPSDPDHVPILVKKSPRNNGQKGLRPVQALAARR